MASRPQLDPAHQGEVAVAAKSASFAWERDMPPALHHISFEATRGQLVMLVGKVGSGKSSLVAALLGELHPRGGQVEVTARSLLHVCPSNCKNKDYIG